MTGVPNRILAIEHLSLAALTSAPRNPRQHTAAQVKRIAASMRQFGNNVPILVDADGRVICGHARLLAAGRLGLSEVPVIRLAHLSPAQAQAFAIADNRLAELATWDERVLGEIFAELTELDLDFSLEVTGFTTAEIDLRIEGLAEPAAGKPDPADDVPETGGIAVTQPGDLWLLDRHRLLCGSALEAVSFQTLMESTRASLVFTDPPYNVPIDGHATGNGAIRHRDFAMARGEMSAAEFTGFLARGLALLSQHSQRGSLHYICMDWRHQAELLAAAQQTGLAQKNLCVWAKDTPGMGSFYRSQHELVFVFKHGTAPHRNNIQLGQFGRNRSNVWSYPAIGSFGRQGEEGKLLALHPTVKPVALVADVILDASTRRDVVLDPFLGSGTTLIAAERVGRVCHGIELDPLYVDTAIRRWQRHCGGQAVHAGTGLTFEQVAARQAEVGNV